MHKDLRPLLLLVRLFVLRESARELRSKGVLYYLKTLRATRRGLIGFMCVILVLQTMMLSLLGALVAGVFLAVADSELRLWILLGVFSVMFLLPFIAIIALFSEKLWYRASGAEKMVEQLDLPPSSMSH